MTRSAAALARRERQLVPSGTAGLVLRGLDIAWQGTVLGDLGDLSAVLMVDLWWSTNGL